MKNNVFLIVLHMYKYQAAVNKLFTPHKRQLLSMKLLTSHHRCGSQVVCQQTKKLVSTKSLILIEQFLNFIFILRFFSFAYLLLRQSIPMEIPDMDHICMLIVFPLKIAMALIIEPVLII